MGILRVDLIDGHQIRGVDRGGKYSTFGLNDAESKLLSQANLIHSLCLRSTIRRCSSLRQRRKL